MAIDPRYRLPRNTQYGLDKLSGNEAAQGLIDRELGAPHSWGDSNEGPYDPFDALQGRFSTGPGIDSVYSNPRYAPPPEEEDDPNFEGGSINEEEDEDRQYGLTDMQNRRIKDDAIRSEQERIKDHQIADFITQDFGRRLNPEAWDRFMAADELSPNVEDRRGDDALPPEVQQDLLDEDDPLGIDQMLEQLHGGGDTEGDGSMRRALGGDDLDRLLQELLSRPNAHERLKI